MVSEWFQNGFRTVSEWFRKGWTSRCTEIWNHSETIIFGDSCAFCDSETILKPFWDHYGLTSPKPFWNHSENLDHAIWNFLVDCVAMFWDWYVIQRFHCYTLLVTSRNNLKRHTQHPNTLNQEWSPYNLQSTPVIITPNSVKHEIATLVEQIPYRPFCQVSEGHV